VERGFLDQGGEWGWGGVRCRVGGGSHGVVGDGGGVGEGACCAGGAGGGFCGRVQWLGGSGIVGLVWRKPSGLPII